MRYFKDCSDGYIYTIGKGNCGIEISEAEYNTIHAIIHNKPRATEINDYRLREDLTWEVYEVENDDYETDDKEAKSGEIPVWKQPTGEQDSYMPEDKVHYPGASDPVYISDVDNNVWAPNVYGWSLFSF